MLLGEARGSGLALGWCFVRSKGKNPEVGSKEAILAAVTDRTTYPRGSHDPAISGQICI